MFTILLESINNPDTNTTTNIASLFEYHITNNITCKICNFKSENIHEKQRYMSINIEDTNNNNNHSKDLNNIINNSIINSKEKPNRL